MYRASYSVMIVCMNEYLDRDIAISGHLLVGRRSNFREDSRFGGA